MEKRPHEDEAGFIDSRGRAGGHAVVVYDALEAGFDAIEGDFVVFCTEHGDLTQGDSLKVSREQMRRPQTWCRGCAEPVSQPPAGRRPLPFAMKSREEQAREIRLAAGTLHGREDKADLFEAIYGVQFTVACPLKANSSDR